MNCINYLSPKEASAFLGCSRRTFETWRRLHGLPVIQIGRIVKVDKAALVDWFNQFKTVGVKSMKGGYENVGKDQL